MMTVEEKAKAYDEAIERAAECYKDGLPLSQPPKSVLEYVFSHLKETKDEKIRQLLIRFVKFDMDDNYSDDFTKEDCLKWLKNTYTKNELKEIGFGFDLNGDIVPPKMLYEAFELAYKNKHKWSEEDEGILENLIEWIEGKWGTLLGKTGGRENVISWLKSIKNRITGDQKEKIPVFEVGDWVANKYGSYQITSIENGMFEFDNSGLKCANIHESYHPWTIKDARAGDILATLDYIIIFKKHLKNDGGVSYCHYDFGAQNPQFNYNEDNNWYFGKEAKITPASKEQRELLFAKMKEAGYEWVKDDLKLIKIIEPEFKVGDWIIHEDNCHITRITCIDDNRVYFDSGTSMDISDSTNGWRLWTIEDAKIGDVLVDKYENIGIYAGDHNIVTWHSLAYCGSDGSIHGDADGDISGSHEFPCHPATKEQRYLLLSKMNEAGYFLDNDKLLKAKFKVGDHIVESDPNECDNGTIKEIRDGKYIFEDGTFIDIAEQNLWQLVGKELTKKELISKIDIDKMVIDYQKKNKCSGSERRSYQQGILDTINTINEK